jgi:hypothetical protein
MVASVPGHVDATLNYLAPESRINRFFWAPEGRYSTVRSVAVPVQILNARALTPPMTLDRNGFTLIERPTLVTDFQNREIVGTHYAAEILDIARALTGADLVVPMGWELRSSAGGAQMQAPAAKVHIDYDSATARQIAERRYRKVCPEGTGYKRFILFSLWRSLTPGPQDWPLALCDHQSAQDDMEERCVKVDVPQLPSEQDALAPIDNEQAPGASALFAPNAAHRWYYYPNMTPDEAVLIKFHDSAIATRGAHCTVRFTT